MKKIIIAAVAATVVGGAFAACTDPGTDPEQWAYSWKFSGKTTKGAKIAGTPGKASLCGDPGKGTDDGYVRVPASLKIQGYTWYCDAQCGDFETLVEANEVFYQKKPFKTSLAGGVTMEVANIIGKKAKQCEVQGTAQFDGTVDKTDNTGADAIQYKFVFAGLGKFDKKNGRVSSVSGNFAGQLRYPWYVSKKVCAEALVWDCDYELVDESIASVAYGKWSVKFYKSGAKKLANKSAKKALKTPSWVTWLNED